jgi:hypothetical protein
VCATIYLSCNGPERFSLFPRLVSSISRDIYLLLAIFFFLSVAGYLALLVYIPFFGFIAAAQLLLLPEKEGWGFKLKSSWNSASLTQKAIIQEQQQQQLVCFSSTDGIKI